MFLQGKKIGFSDYFQVNVFIDTNCYIVDFCVNFFILSLFYWLLHLFTFFPLQVLKFGIPTAAWQLHRMENWTIIQ